MGGFNYTNIQLSGKFKAFFSSSKKLAGCTINDELNGKPISCKQKVISASQEPTVRLVRFLLFKPCSLLLANRNLFKFFQKASPTLAVVVTDS